MHKTVKTIHKNLSVMDEAEMSNINTRNINCVQILDIYREAKSRHRYTDIHSAKKITLTIF